MRIVKIQVVSLFIAFIFITACCVIANGADSNGGYSPMFVHFGLDNGLPSSEVYFVKQDVYGYIWMATDRGIVKYNGQDFEVLTTKDGLADNTNFHIYESSDSTLWFHGFNGVFTKYKDGIISHFSISDTVKTDFPNYNGMGLFLSDSDKVYYYFFDRFYAFNLEGEFLGKYKAVDHFLDFCVPENGTGFLLYSDSVLKFFDEIAFEEYNDKIIRTFVDGDTIISRIKKRKKYSVKYSSYKWLGNQKHIFSIYSQIYSIDKGKVVFNGDVGAIVSEIYQDYSGNLWVCTFDHGVQFYEGGDLEAEPIVYFDSKTITYIMEDHEGGFWLATSDDGVYYLNSLEERSFPGEAIIQLKEWKNDIYLMKDKGDLCKMVGRDSMHWTGITATNKTYFDIDSNAFYVSKTKNQFEIISNEVKNLVHSTDDVLKYDSVWLTNRYNCLSVNFLDRSSAEETCMGKRILALEYLSDTSCLVGSLDGVYNAIWDKNWNLRYERQNWSDHLNFRVNDIKRLNNDSWAFGLHGYGVLILENGIETVLDKRNGLLSDIISKISKIDQNRFLTCSNQGANLIEKTKGGHWKVTMTFTTNEGLLTNEILDVILKEDWLYFGTRKGLSILPFQLNSYAVPIEINSVEINQSDTLLKPYYMLSYDQNNISLNFSGISFKKGKKLIYRYRMNGIDENWVYSSTNKVNYSLPSGEYRFEVSAGFGDGKWSKVPYEIQFDIDFPFWKRIWFWVLVHIFIAGGVGWLIKLINKRKEQRILMEEELIFAKQEALSAQMNPHFMFNALNSLQSQVLKGNKKEASYIISRFSSLMRKILNDSKERLISLEEALEALKLYMDLEQIRTRNKFHYSVSIEEGIDPRKVGIAPLLMQPFVENAIWHGIMPKEENGEIEVRIISCKNGFVIEIEDNGVGRGNNSYKKKNRSHGVDITTKRIQLMNKMTNKEVCFRIEDLEKDGKSIGTKVLFEIPFIELDK